MLKLVLAGFGIPQRPLVMINVYSFGGDLQKQKKREHTQMRLETSHSPQKDLAHLAQIHGIEKEVFRIGRDINFVNAIFCPTKKNALRAEWVRRANWKILQDLTNLSLRCCERVEEGFPNSLHGC